MSAQNDPFFLIELTIVEPGTVETEAKVALEIRRVRDLIKCLAPWRRVTDVSTTLSGSKHGLVCSFSVELAAQVLLDVNFSSANESGLKSEIMLEKRKWIEALANLPLELQCRRLFEASAATVPFRAGTTPMGRAISDDLTLTKEVERVLKAIKGPTLHGHIETDQLQLELTGFEGYSWSKSTRIRALPGREWYGASLTLLSHIPHALMDKPKLQLQLHYSDVSESDQVQIDLACRKRSPIVADVLIGQLANRPTMASLVQLQIPDRSATGIFLPSEHN